MKTVKIHETDSSYLKLPSILKFLYHPLPQVINLLKNHTYVRKVGTHLGISFWHLLMNLKNK